MSVEKVVVLSMMWISYFAIHSLLSGNRVKAWIQAHLPGLVPGYRLLFNLVALLLLIPPLWLLFAWRGDLLWQWSGSMGWLMNGLTLLAVLLFFWSLRYYDSDEFLGLRQLKNARSNLADGEPLVISPLHRCVRHPWYSIGLLLIWSRPMDWTLLVSAACMSLYFVIGSRWEEQRLITLHGERYRRYRQQVPGLLPLPWRCLSQQQARTLLAGPADNRKR